MSEFIVDASVALTWCFPDEHSAEASRILGLIRLPGNRAIVPSFFHQEVLNALLTAERKNRITSAAGHEFPADILTMPFVPEIPNAGRVHSIEDLCRKHALTAYDATYLELAIRLKLPLASFDNALLRASRAETVPTA